MSSNFFGFSRYYCFRAVLSKLIKVSCSFKTNKSDFHSLASTFSPLVSLLCFITFTCHPFTILSLLSYFSTRSSFFLLDHPKISSEHNLLVLNNFIILFVAIFMKKMAGLLDGHIKVRYKYL